MTDRELLELANEYLTYNQAIGEFRWRKSPNRRIAVGKIAGVRLNSDGYKEIQLKGTLYKAHRLAWLMCTGNMPDQIDHMNCDRSDNRLINLRSVSSKENTHNQVNAHKNSSTGVLGVVPRPSGRYAAEIRVNGKKNYIGTFNTIDEASAAYRKAKIELHKGAIR